MAKQICAYCGGQAELLCDYRLGWERLHTKMRQEVPNLAVLPGHAGKSTFRVQSKYLCSETNNKETS